MTRRSGIAGLALAVLLLVALAIAPVATAYAPYTQATSTLTWSPSLPNSLSFAPTTDEGFATIALPFDFWFFGHPYAAGTTLYVSTNGTVSFGVQAYPYADTALPTASFSGGMIAPYWTDFDLTDQAPFNDGARWGVSGASGSRVLSIEWWGHVYNTTSRISFLLDLHEGTNRVDVSYIRNGTDPMADGSTATIGMQEGGTTGEFVQFSHDQAVIPGSPYVVSWAPQTPSNTGLPVITGTPAVGQTLGVSTGTWSGQPTQYQYQWQRCEPSDCDVHDIPGATSATYAVTAADAGRFVWAVVRAANDWAWSGWAQALPLDPIPSPLPQNTVKPHVSGTMAVGQTIATSHGTWTGSPDSYEYRWWRCVPNGLGGCTPSVVAGPSSTSGYTLTLADVGATLYPDVRAHNSYGWSAWVGADNSTGSIPVPTPPGNQTRPHVTGTAAVGQVLTTTAGIWSGSPDQYEYEWWRCVPIGGGGCAPSVVAGPSASATSYTLVAADVRASVYSAVRAHSVHGGWSAWVGSDNDSGAIPAPPSLTPTPGDAATAPRQDAQPTTGTTGLTGAPRITALAIRPTTFRPARRGGSTGTGAGARVAVQLSRAATVTFTVRRATAGRRSRGRCVAATPPRRRLPACTRWVTARGSFTAPGAPATSVTFTFTGRLAGRALTPGHYRLVAVARDAGGASAPVNAAFTVRR